MQCIVFGGMASDEGAQEGGSKLGVMIETLKIEVNISTVIMFQIVEHYTTLFCDKYSNTHTYVYAYVYGRSSKW